MADQILEELWQVREDFAREHDYDTGRMFDYLRSVDGRTAEDWLNDHDSHGSEDTPSYIRAMTETPTPTAEWPFPGGPLSALLFDEAKDCYFEGRFRAAILLGLACAERALAVSLRPAGGDHNRAGQAALHDLLAAARRDGLIDPADCDYLDTIDAKRNDSVHQPDHILERHASRVIAAATRLIAALSKEI